MKLRVKFADSPSHVHRVEVPNSATVQDLINVLFPGDHGDVLLSLNRKDPLSPDLTASLLSCAVRSGDSIWVLNAQPHDQLMDDAQQQPAQVQAPTATANAAAALTARDTTSLQPAAKGGKPPQVTSNKRSAPDSDPGVSSAGPAPKAAGPSSSAVRMPTSAPGVNDAEENMDVEADESLHTDEDLPALSQHLAWFPRTLSRLLDTVYGAQVSEGQVALIPPVPLLRLCAHACMLEAGLELHPDQAVDVNHLPAALTHPSVAQVKYQLTLHPDLPPCNIKFVTLPGFVVLYCYVAGSKTAFQPCTLNISDHIMIPQPQPPAEARLDTPSAAVDTVQHNAGGDMAAAAMDCDAGVAGSDSPEAQQPHSHTPGGEMLTSLDEAGQNEDGMGSGDGVSDAAVGQAYNWAQLFVKFDGLWGTLSDRAVAWLVAQSFLAVGLEPPMGVNQLPQELKMMVLSYLEARDLANLSECSNQWRHLSSVDTLWQPVFFKRFKHPAPADIQVAARRGWKYAYVQKSRLHRTEHRRRAGIRPVVPMFRQPPPFGYYPGGTPSGVVGGDYDRFPLPLLGGGPGMYRQPGPLGFGGMITPGLGFGAPGLGVPGMGGLFGPGRGRGRGQFMSPH